jgi:hypothetical protein
MPQLAPRVTHVLSCGSNVGIRRLAEPTGMHQNPTPTVGSHCRRTTLDAARNKAGLLPRPPADLDQRSHRSSALITPQIPERR